MERKPSTVKLEPGEDLEYIHEETLEIKSEIEPPIKSEQCFREEVQDYQQLEYFPGPLPIPPIKDELLDESNASDNVDTIVRTEMKFCDDSQEINDFTSYHDTPEDTAKVFKI
uniref:Uncharacterized protein n=1 Tax=Timema cristinae TaxID=61476 RepID=A0A7R9DDU3_TIMCR|nr:unnamed protein product [Timema cristinae]